MPENAPIFATAALGAIQLVMIAAKVVGYLHWSWLWVLAPVWLPVLAAAVIAIVVVALFAGSEARGENPFQ